MPHQPTQVEGCLLGSPVFSETAIRNQCAAVIRQSHSNSIPQSHGGPSMTPLCCLALKIWEWCLSREMMIQAEYLPGVENITADW